jgi:predicted component of type VI protein secretion system
MNHLRTLLALALTTVLLTAGCQSKTDSGEQKSVVQQRDTVSTGTNSDTVASDTRK